MFRLDWICETLRCASYLLIERAYWLLQRPPSALCRRITWLTRMNPARSCFNIWSQEIISVQNTCWNDILFDECRNILKLNTTKQNQSWNFYWYPPEFVRCYLIIRLQSAEVAL